jgi:hypothetical protein
VQERERIHIGIGVSESPTGFADAPNAYAEAALTLSYTSPTRPVVALAELRALQLLLLGAGDTTRQVVSDRGRHVHLLPAKERDAAIETILAFSDSNMSISAAASALNIHPNTVRQRLARVAQTTGLDPRPFPDSPILTASSSSAAASRRRKPPEATRRVRRGTRAPLAPPHSTGGSTARCRPTSSPRSSTAWPTPLPRCPTASSPPPNRRSRPPISPPVCNKRTTRGLAG